MLAFVCRELDNGTPHQSPNKATQLVIISNNIWQPEASTPISWSLAVYYVNTFGMKRNGTDGNGGINQFNRNIFSKELVFLHD